MSSSPVDLALTRLNDSILVADATADTFQLLAGDTDQAPLWPFVYAAQVRAIREAAEALETLLVFSASAPVGADQ